MKTLEEKKINVISVANKTYPIVYDKTAPLEIAFANENKLKITSFAITNILPDYSGKIKVYVNDDVDFVKNLYDDCTFNIRTNDFTIEASYQFNEIHKIKNITRIEVKLNYWGKKNVEPGINDHDKTRTVFIIESN
jgi:hypothetical protein